ncbi:MAG: preprotein translocase subunit YajC [Spirochaetia bacterium]|jgi:preprotein translocase subunit YajC|nr:preprotein translocase subunit YajC [Spirochaetia bacterium]
MISFTSSLPVLQAGAGGSMATTFITFGAVIAVFYFFIIRPQNKKQKDTQKMISEIKKFDKIVTIGGIRGVVQAVKDTTIVVKVDDNTKIEFTKSAVATVLEKHESKGDKTDVSASDEKSK